ECYTVCRPCVQPCWRDECYTVCRPCQQTCYRDVCYTVCRPVTQTCWRDECYTTCRVVSETCYRDVCYTVCRPCTETKYVDVCCGEWKTVTECVPGPVVEKCVQGPGSWSMDPCTCCSTYQPGCCQTVRVQCPPTTCCRKVWCPKVVKQAVCCTRWIPEVRTCKVLYEESALHDLHDGQRSSHTQGALHSLQAGSVHPYGDADSVRVPASSRQTELLRAASRLPAGSGDRLHARMSDAQLLELRIDG